MSERCPTCNQRVRNRQKVAALSPPPCRVCGKPVPYQGRGAPRRTCVACLPTWAKLRGLGRDAH
jgi:hypothetical protein